MTASESIKMLEIQKPAYGCKEYKKPLMYAYEMAIKALEEVQQYRAIGTPEELQAAREKQIPKKVKIEQWIYTKCDCGFEFSKHHGDGYYSIPIENKTKYCPNCGQKLDWSDEE